MGLLKKLFSNTTENPFQTKNEAVFAQLREHGFSLPAIRWALMDLNGITLGRLTGGHMISISTASNTIAGRRQSPTVIESLAEALGINAEDLFADLRS